MVTVMLVVVENEGKVVVVRNCGGGSGGGGDCGSGGGIACGGVTSTAEAEISSFRIQNYVFFSQLCKFLFVHFRITLPFHCTPANSKTMLNPY